MTATEAKWERFLIALIDCNWGDVPGAYMSVYGGRDRASASKAANKITTNDRFREFAKKRINELLGEKKAVIGPKVVEAWLTRAFYKVSDILTESGELKYPLEELDRRGLSAAIDSIEQRISKNGKYVVVKLANRDIALEKLSQFVKIIEPATGVKVEVPVSVDSPRIMAVQRLTEDEWQEYYKQITSGGLNQDNSKQ